MTPKPSPLPVVVGNIPVELKERKQWVCWNYEWKENKSGQGRWTKPPYNPKTRRRAKSNEPSTWVTFEEAYSAYKSGRFDGIGFALHPEDGLTGLDLDHCLDEAGALVSWAQDVRADFPEAYWERSPGGDGLRGFCYGRPSRSGKMGPNNQIEVYQPPSSRYLTVTGHSLNGTSVADGQAGLHRLHERYSAPQSQTKGKSITTGEERRSQRRQQTALLSPVELTDGELLEKAMNAKDGAVFSALWYGDISRYGDDPSAADLALCNKLAFWTGGDASRMDSLFRQSGLYRQKWDEKHFSTGERYGEHTIQEAVFKCTDFYEPTPRQPPSLSSKAPPKKEPEKESTLTYKRASWGTMREQVGPIDWSWPDWLAKGLLTILASEPGIGKSALCLRIAQSFIQGCEWPDGSDYTGEKGSVLWCEAESAEAINMERAENWGIPLDKIWDPLGCNPPVSVQLDNTKHKEAVLAAALEDDIRLIIVDSLRGVHKGDENSSATIGVVMWLASLARDTGKPVLLTHHLRKKSVADGDEVTLDRLRGSSAIVQPARVVWALDVPNPANLEKKRLSVIKSNISKFPSALGFSIDEGAIHFGNAPKKPQKETVVQKAADLILALLDKGPLPADEVYQAVDAHGISRRSAKSAKGLLNIVTVKENVPNGKGRWVWSLPADEHEDF